MRKNVIRALVAVLVLAFLAIFFHSPAIKAQQFQMQTITVSGAQITITNSISSTNGIFGETIFGSPATSSIVISGCTSAGTCTTLDTYTGLTNANRIPAIGSVTYSYFTVSATWTGGTNVSVQISSYLSPVAIGSVLNGTGAPTNPCGSGNLYTDNSTGNLWSCNNGAWVLNLNSLPASVNVLGSNSSGGAVSASSANILAACTGCAPLASPGLTGAPTLNTFGSLCAPGDIQSVCMKDEFIANGPATLTNGSFGELRWDCTSISTGSTYSAANGVFPNLGIATITTSGAGQGNGTACQLNESPNQVSISIGHFGILGSNVPWDSEYIIKMGSTTNTRMRIGWMNALSTCYSTNVTSISATCDGFWVRYDTNIGNGAVNVGNNGITRSSGVVTVTVAAHGLSLVGQSVTIASATGCTTSPNGTFAITSIPSTTTYTFNQAGTNETCGGNTPATSTPVADTDYVFETKSGAGSPVASATDSGVSGVTTFVRARIYSLVAGTICFSIYGPSGTLLNGPVCSSTDVATTNMVPTFMFVTDTAGSKIISIDYWSFAATGLAR